MTFVSHRVKATERGFRLAGRVDKSIGGNFLTHVFFLSSEVQLRISDFDIAVANGFAWFSRPTASFFVSPSPGFKVGGRQREGSPFLLFLIK